MSNKNGTMLGGLGALAGCVPAGDGARPSNYGVPAPNPTIDTKRVEELLRGSVVKNTSRAYDGVNSGGILRNIARVEKLMGKFQSQINLARQNQAEQGKNSFVRS